MTDFLEKEQKRQGIPKDEHIRLNLADIHRKYNVEVRWVVHTGYEGQRSGDGECEDKLLYLMCPEESTVGSKTHRS